MNLKLFTLPPLRSSRETGHSVYASILPLLDSKGRLSLEARRDLRQLEGGRIMRRNVMESVQAGAASLALDSDYFSRMGRFFGKAMIAVGAAGLIDAAVRWFSKNSLDINVILSASLFVAGTVLGSLAIWLGKCYDRLLLDHLELFAHARAREIGVFPSVLSFGDSHV